jgi:nitroreductase
MSFAAATGAVAVNQSMDNFEAVMTTTRAVRRRLDFERDVPRALLEECLALAVQAPSGGNAQDWRFIMVERAELRAQLGQIYHRAFIRFVEEPLSASGADAEVAKGRLSNRNAATDRMLEDAKYLAENIHRSPWMVIACATRPNPEHGAAHGTVSAVYGSVFPAVWSFNLALRARGLGTVITTLLLHDTKEVAALLGIPDGVTQCCMLPVAFTFGDSFKPARRPPLSHFAYWDGWGID